MGLAFETPLALLLFVPAFLLTVILHVAARRRVGAGRRRVALVLRSLLLAALVLGLAGLQIVLPVDRLATVFVVDLSDSIGTPGARTRSRSCARRSRRCPRATSPASSRSARTRWSSACRATSPRSTGSPRRRSVRRATSAARCDSRPRCSRTRRRSASSSSPTATTRRGRARPRPRSRRRAGSASRPDRSGSERRDEVLVERASSPSTTRLGEDIEIVSEVRSSVAQPATIRLFVNGIQAGDAQRVDLEEGANTVRFTYTPDRGRLPSLPRRRRGRSRHVQPEQPRGFEHDRPGRAADAGAGR